MTSRRKVRCHLNWRITVAKRACRVEQRLGRMLTDAEWARFEDATLAYDPLSPRVLAVRHPEFYRLGIRDGRLDVVKIAS